MPETKPSDVQAEWEARAWEGGAGGGGLCSTGLQQACQGEQCCRYPLSFQLLCLRSLGRIFCCSEMAVKKKGEG